MIKKWEVAPSPVDKNKNRHRLMIDGEMKDIFFIVKKLGSLCSRPEKSSGDFNFIIYLSKLEPDTMSKLKEVVTELEKSDTSRRERQDKALAFTAPVPPAVPPPAAPPSDAAPVPAVRQPAPPAPVPPPAAPERPAAPPPPPGVTPAPAVRQPAPPAPTPPPALPPDAAAPPSFASPPPAPKGPAALPPQSKPQFSAPFGPPPSVSGRVEPSKAEPVEEKKKEEPKPEPVSPAQSSSPSVSTRMRLKWGVEMPLMPTYTFETLQSGSYNRFAHAAAMAAIDSPGTMYNPLMIFGIPGTGKTHFMHAISYGLSATLGQDKLFVTDGIRLSKGVEKAVSDGSIERLDKMFSEIRALVIDDVHLMMLSAENKPYISKWLNDFTAANKQIVVSSVFPPKSLAGLEEALGFQLSQGWMVDVKVPPASAYKVVLGHLLSDMDVKLSEDEVNRLFINKLTPFGEVSRTLEQIRKLDKFMGASASAKGSKEMLDLLLGLSETAVAGAVSDADYAESAAWKSSENQWFKWGLFHPKGYEKEARFALHSAAARAKDLGIPVAWTQVFTEAYDPDELYGTPFKIGNFAAEKNVNGLIVLGPQPTSALGAQEAEFRHISEKIMRSYSVKTAWLSSNSLKSPSAYVRLLMDLM